MNNSAQVITGQAANLPKRATLSDKIRRPVTFLLALFLWLHALAFVDIHSWLISKCAHILRLTTSEVVLFILLFVFSVVTGSGFWRTLGSLAYIYGFPFVLLGYTFYWTAVALVAIHKWFISNTNAGDMQIDVVLGHPASPPPSPPLLLQGPTAGTVMKGRAAELVQILLRPFRTATLLWCFLLVVTAHAWLLWLSLAVVLYQLIRDAFRLAGVALFSGSLLRQAAEQLRKTADAALAGLEAVTRDDTPKSDLQMLLGKMQLVEIVTTFFRNRDLAIRWAWLLTVFLLGGAYIYFPFFLSFAYYGIARVAAVSYSWPESLVNSLFIPFLIGDLPRIFWAKLLGGIQCSAIVVVGFGTVLNFVLRRLDTFRTEAITLSEKLANQTIRERYNLLKEKAGTPSINPPPG
ncbi:MAG: hypothetical protein ABSA59_24425 [Terriglobia bacterium]|jgi:hypothetical protein